VKVEKAAQAERGGDVAGSSEFARLGALAIAEVERKSLAVAGGNGGCDAAIHAAGKADDGPGTRCGGNTHFSIVPPLQ